MPSLIELPDYRVIAVTGEDSRGFLQGQLTSDVRELGPERFSWSAICNPKGRMIASFPLLEWRGELLLVVPGDLADPLINRLRMYILRARVRIETRPYGLVGLAQARPRGPWPGFLPHQPGEARSFEGGTGLCLPSPTPLALLLSAATGREFRDRLLPGNRICQAPASAWTLALIRAGIPEIRPATSESFVPQMTNLQSIGGISFDKGCYTGQEVVARSQYLGRLKRRMYRLAGTDATPPPPDTPIYAQAANTAVGRVLMAAPAGDGRFEALAVLSMDAADQALTLAAEHPVALQRLDLPYDIG
jgi:folate-binding protein YgfZ